MINRIPNNNALYLIGKMLYFHKKKANTRYIINENPATALGKILFALFIKTPNVITFV